MAKKVSSSTTEKKTPKRGVHPRTGMPWPPLKGEKRSVEEMKVATNFQPWNREHRRKSGLARRNKKRQQTYLKSLLSEGLDQELPEEWRDELRSLKADGKLDGVLIDVETVGQAIAGRILARAFLGNDKAVDQIIATEPKEIEMQADIQNASVSELANELAAIAKRRTKILNSGGTE